MRLLIAASALFFLTCQTLLAEESETAVTTVTTVKPEHRDVTRWLSLPAYVDPDAEVTLYAKVSGFLKDFSVDVGDIVKPGQIIGRLEAPELEQDVKVAETQLVSAEADFQKAAAELENEEIKGKEFDAEELIAKADLAKDKAEQARLKDQCDRTEKLFANNAATELERENEKYLCLGADASVVSAERKLDKFKTDRELWQKEVAVSKSTVEAAKSKVGMAKAALERAKVWLSFTDIRIPQVGTHAGASAVITQRLVANGDLIAGGMGSRSGIQPIVTLQVSDPVRVVADIPEADSIGLSTGTLARIVFPDWTGEPAMEKISRTSNALSPRSRTLRVEIDIPNPQNKLRPGMMAKVEFAKEIHKGVLAVPAECVVSDRRDNSVFTVDGGKVKKVSVDIRLRGQPWCEISSPSISENTVVVKDIVDGVADGAVVQVKQ